MNVHTVILCLASVIIGGQAQIDDIYRYDGDKVHTYSLDTTTAAWAAGRTACKVSNDDLATLEDTAEIDFIDNNLGLLGAVVDDPYWIGASGSDWIDLKTTATINNIGSDFTIVGGAATDNDYIYIAYTTGTPDKLEFKASLVGGSFAILCENAADTTGKGDSIAFTAKLGGTIDRHFFILTTKTGWAGSLAACVDDGNKGMADSWMANIASDAELTALLDLGEVTEDVWIGISRDTSSVTWSWVNDAAVSTNAFNGGTVPTTAGYAYLTYKDSATIEWASDATGATTDREAICETIGDAETNITDAISSNNYRLTAALTWSAARDECRGMTDGNFDLAILDAATDRTWLVQNLARLGVSNADELWFGASDTGNWTWVDKREIDGAFGWATDHPVEGGCGYFEFAESPLAATYKSVADCGTVTARIGVCMTAGHTCRTVGDVETCYQGSGGNDNKTDAKTTCEDMGLTLVVIEDEAEQTWLNDNLDDILSDNGEVWMGLTNTTTVWEWDNEAALTVDNWNDGQPEATKDCGYILWKALTGGKGNATWSSDDCTAATRPGLCEASGTISSSTTDSGSGGLSGGAIAGIVIGSLVVVGAVVGGVVYFMKRSKPSVSPDGDADVEEGGNQDETEDTTEEQEE